MAILTPILLDKSAFGAYFLFGGLALFTVAVLGACMPETRGRSLEDIQQAFHQPSNLKALTSRVKLLTAWRREGENGSVTATTPHAQPDESEDGSGNTVELSMLTNPELREPVMRPLRVAH